MSDGLIPPLNAPPAGQVVTGVQPGVSNAIVFANQVIVFGPSGSVSGVFAYQLGTTPGPGNPPMASLTFSNSDPFGNPVQQGFVSYSGSSNFIQVNAGAIAFAIAPLTAVGAITQFLNGGSGELTLTAPQNATDNPASLTLRAGPSGTPAVTVMTPAAAIQPGAGNDVPETWHAVTLPPGMTGTLRVKLLAEGHFAALDVNVSITSSLAAANTYAGGALPSAGYYPAGSRQFPLSVNGQYTANSNASPRVVIPVSPGTISFPMPAFAVAGVGVIVSGLIIYPLD